MIMIIIHKITTTALITRILNKNSIELLLIQVNKRTIMIFSHVYIFIHHIWIYS